MLMNVGSEMCIQLTAAGNLEGNERCRHNDDGADELVGQPDRGLG